MQKFVSKVQDWGGVFCALCGMEDEVGKLPVIYKEWILSTFMTKIKKDRMYN